MCTVPCVHLCVNDAAAEENMWLLVELNTWTTEVVGIMKMIRAAQVSEWC